MTPWMTSRARRRAVTVKPNADPLVASISWHGRCGLLRAMPPNRADPLETTLLARERTLAELTARVARITAELNDDEILRLLHSVLEARDRARGDGRAPPS